MLDAIVTGVQAVIMVALVLYLAYVVTRYVGKSSRLRVGSRHIKVIDRAVLSQDSSVAIVKVGNECLLLGVSSERVSVLRELKEEDLGDLGAVEDFNPPGFKSIMDKVRKKGGGE